MSKFLFFRDKIIYNKQIYKQNPKLTKSTSEKVILSHDGPYFGKHTFFFQMKGKTKVAFIQDEIKAFTFKNLTKSLVKKESYFLSS